MSNNGLFDEQITKVEAGGRRLFLGHENISIKRYKNKVYSLEDTNATSYRQLVSSLDPPQTERLRKT